MRRLPDRVRLLLVAGGLLGLTGCAPGGAPSSIASSSAPSPATSVSAGGNAPPATPSASLTQRTELSLPVAREETAAAATTDTLLVAGGLDAAGRDRAEVFRFSGGGWNNGPQLPVAVDHASATTLGDTVYVAGGFTAGIAQAAVSSLGGASAVWVAEPSLHHPRGALALLPYGGRLYAVGGKDGRGTEVPFVETWAPGEPAWRDLGAMPDPRDHLAGFVTADRLCVAGGRRPTTARVDCLDTAGTWSPGAPLPAATSGAAAGVIGATVIVAGGEDAAETRLVDRVDTLAGQLWTTTPMLYPRHGIEAVPFHGRLWLCGGGTAPGLHPTTTVTSVGPG